MSAATGGLVVDEHTLTTYHIRRAEAGDHDSARWLRDNIWRADRDGRPVDPYVRLLVRRMRKGGLRKSRRVKKRGQRGPGLGEHRQLLLAREVWKHRHLAGCTPVGAADKVAIAFQAAYESARNAYYRFQRGANRRVLCIELARDFADDQEGWRALARSDDRLENALRTLQRLRVISASQFAKRQLPPAPALSSVDRPPPNFHVDPAA